MANKRCLKALARHFTSILAPSSPSLQSLKTLNPTLQQIVSKTLLNPLVRKPHTSACLRPICFLSYTSNRHFSSHRSGESEDNEDEEDEEGSEDEEVSEDESDSASNHGGVKTVYSLEETEAEAAAIGYKVVGPLQRSDRVFKPYEPVFAVVQIGSHQFKVSNGDCIFTERLKFCEVNDKLILDRVLMLGSRTQTIIGRPILSDAVVHAVVEEHALDAKVIIFKKKRRKNYRRTKGHRQELTKLRITDIQGIEKPEVIVAGKKEKVAGKKPEKAPVAA
ncbi:hypothetical protein NMG60_11012721 [Bertholletia excelsa]